MYNSIKIGILVIYFRKILREDEFKSKFEVDMEYDAAAKVGALNVYLRRMSTNTCKLSKIKLPFQSDSLIFNLLVYN